MRNIDFKPKLAIPDPPTLRPFAAHATNPRMQQIPTRVPIDFLFRTTLLFIIMIVCLVLAVSAATPFQAYEIWVGMLYGFPVLILGTLFDLYLRKGYRVSYTDDAVHWRKIGLSRGKASQIVMPFKAVSHIVAEAGSLGIKPFEAAILNSHQQDAADIILSTLYLRQDDLRDFLAMVSAKSEALIDEEVSAFIGG